MRAGEGADDAQLGLCPRALRRDLCAGGSKGAADAGEAALVREPLLVLEASALGVPPFAHREDDAVAVLAGRCSPPLEHHLGPHLFLLPDLLEAGDAAAFVVSVGWWWWGVREGLTLGEGGTRGLD